MIDEGALLIRVFALLAISLALGNAQCFLRCELGDGNRNAPPCHSQSKQIQEHCIELHDVKAPAPHVDTVAWAPVPEPAHVEPAAPMVEPIADVSPPSKPFAASSQPLRI